MTDLLQTKGVYEAHSKSLEYVEVKITETTMRQKSREINDLFERNKKKYPKYFIVLRLSNVYFSKPKVCLKS